MKKRFNKLSKHFQFVLNSYAPHALERGFDISQMYSNAI